MTKLSKLINKNYLIVFGLSGLIAALISLTIGLNQSVWFDEAYSILVAKQPIGEIIRLVSVDTHPPIYYILLHLWGGLFGWSELSLRMMSVIPMGLAVIFGALLTKKLFGIKAALFSLPFMIFAPLLLRYGFEIRMYSLASLIGVSATYALVAAMTTNNSKNKLRWFLVYGFLVAIGMYTLYNTALLWLAHFGWLAYYNIKHRRPFIKSGWLMAYGLSLLLFLPWLPSFIKQIGNGALAPISQPMTLDNLISVASFSFIYRPNWQLGAIGSIVMLLVIVAVARLIFLSYRKLDKTDKPYFNLLICYVGLPLLIMTVVGIFVPLYTERYLSQVMIGGSLVLGVVSALSFKKLNSLNGFIIAGLIICMIFGTLQLAKVGNFNFQRLQNVKVKQAAKALIDCNNSKTLANDPYVATELSYYSKCPVFFYSDNANLGGGYAPLANSDMRLSDPVYQLKYTDHLYYVYYGDGNIKLPSRLRAYGIQSFGPLHIKVYSSQQ